MVFSFDCAEDTADLNRARDLGSPHIFSALFFVFGGIVLLRCFFLRSRSRSVDRKRRRSRSRSR